MSDQSHVPDGMRGFRPMGIVSAAIGIVLVFVQLDGQAVLLHRIFGMAVVVMSIIMASLMYRTQHRAWGVALSFVALVFLPLWQMQMWLWWILDGLCIVILLGAAIRFKGPPPEKDPENLPDRFM
ncbi:hypothetical protein [Pseudoclavibacter sp. CFCC 13611]|uniref:hypothetical protein n=1 Tax=Pseudoclavibacter sp. CFCC 13611 TaxID=2615178 RepID=UPI0013018F4E|nr:hypothetical protein [Pseudoclavibacter sp. CFCC 13611]KAB1664287.1 hypothetical protein F8O08_02475 [Pseudoclavibacter sp. CFCC 13611]